MPTPDKIIIDSLGDSIYVFVSAMYRYIAILVVLVSVVHAEDTSAGAALFRRNCGSCHGADAHGGAGPDLTKVTLPADEALFRIINSGIPGSAMPASNLRAEEIQQVIAYIRMLRAPAEQTTPGDAKRGEQQFFGAARCSSCHTVNGRGGRFGPELSRLSSSITPEYLETAIRNPGASFPAETLREWGGVPVGRFRTVLVTMPGGTQIIGVRLNEDTFTLQVMDKSEKLYLIAKSDATRIETLPGSLMPAFDKSKLEDSDLRDIVAFLLAQRVR